MWNRRMVSYEIFSFRWSLSPTRYHEHSQKKAHALTLFIAAMKIQIFILGLLVDYSDYIPCSPPAVSPVHMKQSRSQSVIPSVNYNKSKI